MNRTILCAMAAIFSVSVVTPAFAQQDNFADVPDNHWAYDALKNLKAAGILVGYPLDQLYHGSRVASRYEMAVAINAAYTRLKAITDGLDSQIKALSDKLNGLASAADLQNLRDALTALQNDVNSMKGWGDDIANLKRLADTFQKELQSLGVDVEAMKKDLGDLAQRVTILEKRKPTVNISGDLNVWMGAGNSRDHFGLDMDGRINGVSLPNNPAAATPVGLDRDLVFLHEGAFNFSGTNDTGPKWSGTVVVGNMLGGTNPGDGFGNQSQGGGYGFGYAAPNEDVYVQNFSVIFNTSVVGLAFNANIGRVGYKISPYIYQREDRTSYFSNDRWDNGKYYFDGGIIGFNLGGAKLDVFAGVTPNSGAQGNPVTSVQGTPLDPVVSGPINGAFAPGGATIAFDRQLGGNLNIPLSTAGNLDLAYLWLDSDNTNAASLYANRLAVYGGTLDLHIGPLKLEGGYSATDLQYNTSNIVTNNNQAYYGKAMIGGNKWGLWGGYRVVEGNYLAPGDWGRLGVFRNPTNIKGFQVGGHLDLTHALTLKADGEFDKGESDTFEATTGFNTGTTIDKWSVGLDFKATSNLSLYAGYENDTFNDLTNPGAETITGNPNYKWGTFGIGYGLSDTAKLTIQYQISDVTHDYQVSNNGTFRGGFLTSQLSIKF